MTTYVMLRKTGASHSEFRIYNDLTQPEVLSILAADNITDYHFVTNPDDITAMLGTPIRVIDTNSALRTQATEALQSGTSALNKLDRAILLSIIDAINVLRQRDVDRSSDVAAATSLADLKARWAARSTFQDITVQQAKTFVMNKINAGDAD